MWRGQLVHSLPPSLTLAWLMSSPMKVDINTDRDIGLFLRLLSCRPKGNPVTETLSGSVKVYDCRMLNFIVKRKKVLHGTLVQII